MRKERRKEERRKGRKEERLRGGEEEGEEDRGGARLVPEHVVDHDDAAHSQWHHELIAGAEGLAHRLQGSFRRRRVHAKETDETFPPYLPLPSALLLPSRLYQTMLFTQTMATLVIMRNTPWLLGIVRRSPNAPWPACRLFLFSSRVGEWEGEGGLAYEHVVDDLAGLDGLAQGQGVSCEKVTLAGGMLSEPGAIAAIEEGEEEGEGEEEKQQKEREEAHGCSGEGEGDSERKIFVFVSERRGLGRGKEGKCGEECSWQPRKSTRKSRSSYGKNFSVCANKTSPTPNHAPSLRSIAPQFPNSEDNVIQPQQFSPPPIQGQNNRRNISRYF